MNNIDLQNNNSSVNHVLLLQLILYLSYFLPCKQYLILLEPHFQKSMYEWVLLLKNTSQEGIYLTLVLNGNIPDYVDERRSAIISFRAEAYKSKGNDPVIFVFVTSQDTELANVAPDVVSSSSIFIIAKLSKSSIKVYRFVWPAPALRPKVYFVAFYAPNYNKWTLHDSVPPLYQTKLENATTTIAISLPFKVPSQTIIELFVRNPSNIFWSLLRLHFNFRQLIAPMYQPSNGSLVQINVTAFQMVQKKVDAMSVLILTSGERLSKIGFIFVDIDIKYYFLIRQPEFLYSYLGIFRPLSYRVWLALLIMIFIVATVLFLINAAAPDSTLKIDFPMSLMLSLGFSCSQARLGYIKNLSIQIICLSAFIFFYLGQQFYISNLYSIVSTREVNYPFNTLEELIERKTHRVMIHPETSVYTSLQTAHDGAMKNFWVEFLRDDPGHSINDSNIDEVSSRICDGSTTLLAVPSQTLSLPKKCEMRAIPTGYFPTQVALVVRKDFPFSRHFQAFITRIKEVGVINYLYQFQFGKVAYLNKERIAADLAPLSLQQVKILFDILLGFTFLSCFLLILENCHYYYYCKRFKSKILTKRKHRTFRLQMLP